MLPRSGARPLAAPLPVHRQRPRRGDPGEAAGAGGHHRSFDPAPDRRRQLWGAGRVGTVDRRILRRGTGRPAAGPTPPPPEPRARPPPPPPPPVRPPTPRGTPGK